MSKILLVEDDQALASMIIQYLSGKNYTVEHSVDAADGEERLRISSYDLLIIDWNLPDRAGVDLVSEYRSRGGQLPVLFLTGMSAVQDKLRAFGCGADDYMTKPFNVNELGARITAILRRPPQLQPAELSVRDITLHLESRQVFKGGQEVQMLPKEFELLAFFMKNQDKVLSSRSIIDGVWLSDSLATDHTFRQCLARLRKKLDTDSDNPLIKNLHGVGYRLSSDKSK